MSNEIRDSIMGSLLGEQKHKGLYISGLTTLDREICSSMFNRCKADIIDMSDVDISYAVDMSNMFSWSRIQTIILPRMSAHRLKRVSHMFAGCCVGHIDMSGFDAPSIVEMYKMFTYCDIEHLDLSCLRMDSVKDTRKMFYECKAKTIKVRHSQTKLIEQIRLDRLEHAIVYVD